MYMYVCVCVDMYRSLVQHVCVALQSADSGTVCTVL